MLTDAEVAGTGSLPTTLHNTAVRGSESDGAAPHARPLAAAPAAFAPDRPAPGKTIIRITED
ncbi:hypothetical protein ACWEQ2_04285 [Streptomyces sp. NPDC004096]|uniref:hypothetical protein n=1 Tax=unclassified Streptomyces TaxID=2593676 RepID=UPI00339E1D9A